MKKASLTLTIILALLLVSPSSWLGSAIGAQPTDMFLLAFGKGKVEVKLYSDYFCGACKNLEPNIEYLVTDLVKRNIVTITFVDVPMHKHSALYARHFLYILNAKKEIGHALKARAALFEAAQQKIADSDKLEEFLASKGFKLKPFDVKPVFAILHGYLRVDNINATPTAVTSRGGKKEFDQGVPNITRLLEGLK
jgi:thiol:disulfide interchange protein DsbA